VKINNTFINNFVCLKNVQNNVWAILHHICSHLVSEFDVKKLMLRFHHWTLYVCQTYDMSQSEIASYIQCHMTEVGPVGTQYFSQWCDNAQCNSQQHATFVYCYITILIMPSWLVQCASRDVQKYTMLPRWMATMPTGKAKMPVLLNLKSASLYRPSLNSPPSIECLLILI